MRILPCNNNTTWGVQVSPYAPNKYGKAMSFDDEATKEAYFADYIFWPKWKESLKNSPNKINTINSATEADFLISLDDINKSLPDGIGPWTYEEVLQKDLMCSYDDITGQIKYWAIQVQSANAKGVFHIIAKLDEFSNYDIVHGLYRDENDSMFMHGRQPLINRATIQNYYKDDNGIMRTLNGMSNYGFLSEPFDDTQEKEFFPTSELQEIKADYANVIVDGHDNPNYDKINEELNNKDDWKIAFFSLSTFTGKNNSDDFAQVKQGFTYASQALGTNTPWDMVCVWNQTITDNNNDSNTIAGLNKDLPYVMLIINTNDKQSSNGIVDGPLYTEFFTNSEAVYSFADVLAFLTNEPDYKEELFNWDEKTQKIYIDYNFENNPNDDSFNDCIFAPVKLALATKDKGAIPNGDLYSINAGRGLIVRDPIKLFKQGILSDEYKLPIDWDKITADTGKFNPYQYTKLNKSAYQLARILGTDGASFDIREEYLDTDTFKLKMNVIPMTDIIFTGISIIPQNVTENTIYKGTTQDYRNEYIYREFAKNGNILHTNRYMDMLTNEENSFNTRAKILKQNLDLASIFGPLSSIFGIGSSAASAASFKGGAMGITGSMIGGAESTTSGIIGAQQAISQFNAQIKDMKESPNKISGDAMNLFVNKYSTGIKPQIQFMSIPEVKKGKFAWNYHVKGATLGFNADINNFLNTHEFWDFIQADNTFEIFNLELATQVRQNISNALSQGIEIVHIRKDYKTRFKGVSQYDVTNKQMSDQLIGSFNDIWK